MTRAARIASRGPPAAMTSPSFSTTTRSDSSRTARMRCSTKRMATPRSRIWRIRWTALAISPGLRPDSTSSSRITRGRPASARSSSRNLRSCRLSSWGSAAARRPSPVNSSQARASARASAGAQRAEPNVAAVERRRRFRTRAGCREDRGHRDVGGAPPLAARAPEDGGHQALGQQKDYQDEDEGDHRAAEDGLLAAGERVERGRDEGRAHRGAQPVARAAEDGHQHDVERHGDREGVGNGEVAHVHGVDAAGDAGDPRRQRERHELVRERRHALDLGDVLVVVDGEQAEPEPRARDRVRDGQREDGETEGEEGEGAGGRGDEARKRHVAQVDAGPAVQTRVEDDRRQHERDGEREQTEQLAAQALDPEDDGADADAQQRSNDRRHGQGGEERRAEARRERGHRVHAGAEEGAVAEAEIAGVTAQQAPARGERDPVEDEVEEGLVEGRQPDQRQHREDESRGEKADGLPHTRSGRSTRSPMRIENETSGAHAGAATAIVTDSLTPIRNPASSAPTGLPRPPMITTAKTVPSQAQICAGASVEMSAMNAPATPA